MSIIFSIEIIIFHYLTQPPPSSLLPPSSPPERQRETETEPDQFVSVEGRSVLGSII